MADWQYLLRVLILSNVQTTGLIFWVAQIRWHSLLVKTDVHSNLGAQLIADPGLPNRTLGCSQNSVRITKNNNDDEEVFTFSIHIQLPPHEHNLGRPRLSNIKVLFDRALEYDGCAARPVVVEHWYLVGKFAECSPRQLG